MKNDMHVRYAEMVTKLKKPGSAINNSLTDNQCDLLHMVVGISGEAGELLDAVKKATIYQKPIDYDNVVEELGDLEFYMEGVRQILNISRDETLNTNATKLLTGKNARYADGFYSDKAAQERADKEGE